MVGEYKLRSVHDISPILSVYQTIRTFNDPERKAFENIVGKGEKRW